MTHFVLAGALGFAGFLAGCSAVPRSPEPQADYVLIYLLSGPNSGAGDKDQRAAMFAGHMANIQRLADEHSLLIAGPFADPVDKTWRGILLVDVPTVPQATALAESDPGVRAGEFTAECRPIRAAVALRRTGQLQRAMLEEAKGNPPPPADSSKSSMPPNICAYVMITAEDFVRARRAIGRSPWKGNVVWSAQFTGTQRGVLVVNAPDPQVVRDRLADTGPCTIDGWWSTKALMRLSDV